MLRVESLRELPDRTGAALTAACGVRNVPTLLNWSINTRSLPCA